MMYILTLIFILLSVLSVSNTGMAQPDPSIWKRTCDLGKLSLKDLDRYCRSDMLIQRLWGSGIPVNIELYPIDSNIDLIKSINPKTGEKEFKATPRKTPWKLMQTPNNKAKVMDVIRYYAAEAGGYRVVSENDMVCLLPDSSISVTDKIAIEPFQKKSTNIQTIFNELIANHNFNLSILTLGQRQNLALFPIDLTFQGGDLKSILNSICAELTKNYPGDVYTWGISTFINENGILTHTLGFGAIPNFRLDAVLLPINID